MLLGTFFSFTGFFFIPFLGELPAFCTILPFQFGCQLIIFRSKNSLLAPKIILFNDYFALLSHVFHGSKEFYLYHCGVFLCLSPPIQPHFTLRFAPFYLAFSTKTHCVLRHIALHFAAKCTAFSRKQPKNQFKWRSFQINIHFANIYN